MANTPPPGHPVDDRVLWVVISFCILTAVGLTTLWAFEGWQYPPMLIAMLLAIAVAALTYRYLGGVAFAELKIGLLKLGGSAALLIGTAWLTNSALSKQMTVVDPEIKINAAESQRNAANNTAQELEQKLSSSSQELTRLKASLDENIVNTVRHMRSGTDQAKELIEMAKYHKGPFSSYLYTATLKATFIGLPAGTLSACDNLNLESKLLSITRPDAGDGGGEIKTVTASDARPIERGVCENAHRKFDIQMSCQDGALLFSEQIAGCASSGAVEWRTKRGGRVFPVKVDVSDP